MARGARLAIARLLGEAAARPLAQMAALGCAVALACGLSLPARASAQRAGALPPPDSRRIGRDAAAAGAAGGGQQVGPVAETPPEPPTQTEPAHPGEPSLFPPLPLASAAGWILQPEPAPSSPEERGGSRSRSTSIASSPRIALAGSARALGTTR